MDRCEADMGPVKAGDRMYICHRCHALLEAEYWGKVARSADIAKYRQFVKEATL